MLIDDIVKKMKLGDTESLAMVDSSQKSKEGFEHEVEAARKLVAAGIIAIVMLSDTKITVRRVA